jgi:SAM-dependent methyltransferase
MTRNADTEHWSRVSSEWIEWARAPNHDAFWAYRESLIAFVGRGAGEALDVGCGEGRVSRELKACGYRVTALDPVRELVNAAREARSADDYAIASGTDLPFDDARFNLVMAYNVLMDVEDVSATLKEMRRVLRPAGMLVISIVHPFSDRGRFANGEATSPFVIHDGYFGSKRFEGMEERGWPANAFRRVGEATGSLRDRFGGGRARNHVRSRTSSASRRWMESHATLDPNSLVSLAEGAALGIAMIGCGQARRPLQEGRGFRTLRYAWRQDEETSAASVPRDPFLENAVGDVAHPEVGLSSSSV